MTLVEIARLAGVSRTTASYIVNGKARERRIREETIERVMAVVREYGYRVDAQAAALRRGSSRILGLIVPDLENSSYARLAKYLERGARQQGYQLLIVGSDDQPDSERELALSLRAQRCEALITASCLTSDDPFYLELLREGLPIIGVDRGLASEHFASVVSNDAEAARQLTESVIADSRIKHVLWLDAVPQLSISRERRAGFETAVTHQHVDYRMISAERYDRALGALLFARYLDEHGLPDALIAASYTLLEGVLDILRERGLPERLAMASFGDNRLLDFLPLAVNSMVQDHEAIARHALALALLATRGDYQPQRVVVPRHPLWRAGSLPSANSSDQALPGQPLSEERLPEEPSSEEPSSEARCTKARSKAARLSSKA